MKHKYYCDDCGDELGERQGHVITSLLFAVSSANVGESAILCSGCLKTHNQKENTDYAKECRMIAELDYGECGGVVEVERGKEFEILREEAADRYGVVNSMWSTRSGFLRLPSGQEIEAVLELCDTDSGEHWGTAVWTPDGLVWQDNAERFVAEVCQQIGLESDKRHVFPYSYKYHGELVRDHHVGPDGWSV